MNRREFITLLGVTAAAWPLAARAQQPGRLPTIGFLGSDASFWSPWTAAFVERLRELGWIEGRTIAIEYRWSFVRGVDQVVMVVWTPRGDDRRVISMRKCNEREKARFQARLPE
jgi:uncharacterized DUF497 family protein